jgi:hypothetical protein
VSLKNLSINVIITVGAICVCLLLFEIGIRIFQLTPDTFLQADSRTGVWHIPNKEGIYFRKDVPKIPVHINSQGLRDYEYPYQKGENTYRIALLGDSFTQAIQIPLEDTYQQILENMLNSGRMSTHFEVINYGIGGFGTTHEYFVFLHHVLEYRPDMVLLGFTFENDIFENSPILNGRKYLPYLVIGENNTLVYLPPEPVPYYMRLGAFFKMIPFFYYRIVKGNSRLETLLRGIKRGSVNNGGIPLEYYMYARVWDPEWREAWEITKQVLLRLDQETISHNITFMIVGIPGQIQIDPQIQKEVFALYPMMAHEEWDWEKPNKLLRGFCQSKGIHYFDLSPLFKEKIRQSALPLYYHDDGHWNQNGHRLAAESIYHILIEKLSYLLTNYPLIETS